MRGTSTPRNAAAWQASQRLRPILERLAADGLGVRLMAQALAREGILSAAGRPMDPATVRRHLERLGLSTAVQEAGTYGGSAHGERIRDGLQRARAPGVPIGNSAAAVAAREARAAAAMAWAESMRDQLEELAAAGLGWAGIARALNADGVTRDDRPVGVGTVRAALQRLGIRTARSRGER